MASYRFFFVSVVERGIILAISHTFPEITVNKRPKRDLPSVGLLTEDDLPYEGTKKIYVNLVKVG